MIGDCYVSVLRRKCVLVTDVVLTYFVEEKYVLVEDIVLTILLWEKTDVVYAVHRTKLIK